MNTSIRPPTFIKLFLPLWVLAMLAPACTAAESNPGQRDAFEIHFEPSARQYPRLEPAPAFFTGMITDLKMERSHARKGERWIEVDLSASDAILQLADAQWHIALFATDDPVTPVAETRVSPRGAFLRIGTDLRSPGLEQARLRIDLRTGGKTVGSAEALLAAETAPAAPTPGQHIVVDFDLPEGVASVEQHGVTFGVPFPAGGLWSREALQLTDASGQPVPFQTEVSARWARDGSIKWLRVDALADSARGLAITGGPAQPKAPRTALDITRTDDAEVRVTHGKWEYRIGSGGALLQDVLFEGTAITRPGGRGLYVVDQMGRLATASARGATLEVESAGPVAGSIRIEGPYLTADGEERARHITRLEFFAGQPGIQATHTLILSRDTEEIWLREVGWEWKVRAGENTRAFLPATNKADARILAFPISADASIYVWQKDHLQFGGGENQFAIVREGTDGSSILHEGERMGDWAALQGTHGGWWVACRDAARQHPKEIDLATDRVTLRLFSPRSGDTLDFRSPALLERWNRGGQLTAAVVAEARQAPSNAAGWAKTHHLMLLPLTAEDPAEAMATRSRLHSEPAYLRVDPAWIAHSRAMGPLSPIDRDRFPDEEAFIGAAGNFWQPRMFQSDDYGFVDYAAGPHHSAMGSGTTRYHLSYTVRHDMWLLYARGGERGLRQFAETSNRAYLDGNIAHIDVADAPGPRSQHKYRGMFTTQSDIHARLPYYWGTSVGSERSTSTNLDQFLYDYYLTGYRRAGEIVDLYADGVQRWWHEGRTSGRDFWREKIFLQALTQAYNHTFDPALLPIVDAVIDYTYGPDGVVRIDKQVPHHTTNKLPSDIQPLIQAWEFFGDRRIEDMAQAVAAYLTPSLGSNPLDRTRLGMLADYLYRTHGGDWIGEAVALSVRQANAATPESSSSVAVFRLQGMPYALTTVAATGADLTPTASWVAYQSFGNPTAVIVRKEDAETIRLHYRGGQHGMRVFPLGDTRSRLSRVFPETVLLPYDDDAGDYLIRPGESGENFIIADASVPMVVYAPHYWRPGPELEEPRSPVYFRVEDTAQNPQIFFEGKAVLIAPDGFPWPDDTPHSGWVNLPADTPGLWAFVPRENHLVRVHNVPPFFAFRDPRSHFVPTDMDDIETLLPQPEGVPAEAFAGEDGAAAGLTLGPGQSFRLRAGDEKAEGGGLQALPFQDGTVEFWFRPSWSSFDLDARRGSRYDRRTLATLIMSDQTVDLHHNMCLERVQWPPSRYNYSHTLRANFTTDGPSNIRTPGYLRHVFDADEWVHVAWVWGQKPMKTRRGQESGFETRIYVNGGLAGQRYSEARLGNTLPHPVSELVLDGDGLQGMIRDLRVSDNQRYTHDFTPPPPGTLFPDRHTLALREFTR